MSEQLALSLLPSLINKYYGVSVAGKPTLLHARDGQQVFKLDLEQGGPLTVRLCTANRSQEKVLADSGALLFLNQAEFPAPKLRLTSQGERIFQWQPGCWGYAQEYIEGENPFMDLPTLSETGWLLGNLHRLVSTPAEYPVQVGWLEELPVSIHRAGRAATDPVWGKIAYEVAENLQNLPDLSSLPLGLIHTDIHEGNLLRSREGPLYLLDWEDAGLGEAIFDLALVLGWNCVWQSEAGINLLKPKSPPERYDFDEEYCRTLLGNYQHQRPLSDFEMQMLGPAIRFVMGWFAARDIERELEEPGVSEGLAFTNWAIMRSVTPEWSATLAHWAYETRPASQPGSGSA